MHPDHPINHFHHITLVTRDAESTVAFYTETLGLTFIKKTVNFDRPDTYHLYFGDPDGSPGSLVTFFVWPDAEDGQEGIGVTQHFALRVESDEAQLKWKRRLSDLGITVLGPYDHHAYRSIIFSDPSGILVEIATAGPGWTDFPRDGSRYQPPLSMEAPFRDEAAIATRTWHEPVPHIEPDMQLQGLHHISPITANPDRTNDFYQNVLGISLLLKSADDDDPDADRWHWGLDDGRNGTVTYYVLDPARWDGHPPMGKLGAGLTHHFAFMVDDQEALLTWRERLQGLQIDVTPVFNRNYFQSIYLNDPDGQIIEIATAGPGFLFDQPRDRLGKDLALPPSLEPRRAEIEAGLPAIKQRENASAGSS